MQSQNLKEGLFSSLFSDLHFRVKDEGGDYVVIHAHKIVIWCRSETLLKELTSREFSDPETYSIDSISLECLKRLLEYIYTDHFNIQLENWSKQLLDEFISVVDRYYCVISCNFNRHPALENLSKRCKQMGFVSSLQSDFQKAVNNPEYSDIVLLSSTSRIPAHRVLLSARSNFFKAMLGSTMKETRLREISLETTSSELLLLLLEFIYTERIQKLPAEFALELLELSDRFSILGKLTRLCEDSLRTAIDNSNVIDVIQFANLHQASLLKRVCVQYMLKEYDSLEAKMKEELPPELTKEINFEREKEFANSKEGIEKKLRQERHNLQEEERKALAEVLIMLEFVTGRLHLQMEEVMDYLLS